MSHSIDYVKYSIPIDISSSVTLVSFLFLPSQKDPWPYEDYVLSTRAQENMLGSAFKICFGLLFLHLGIKLQSEQLASRKELYVSGCLYM